MSVRHACGKEQSKSKGSLEEGRKDREIGQHGVVAVVG
jgi:hypothetical protein